MRFLGQDFNQKLLKKNEKFTDTSRDIGYRFHLPNLHGNIGLAQLSNLMI